MQDEYLAYLREIDNIKFIGLQDMSQYLEYMKMPGYTVFFSIGGDGTSQLDDALKQKFRELGFTTEFTDKMSYSFLGVLDTGKGVIYEYMPPDTTQGVGYSGILSNGTTYSLGSHGDFSGNSSSIVIDNKEYSRNIRGFNIVVYDNINERIVDCTGYLTSLSAGLNYDKEPRPFFREYTGVSAIEL
jgi:hypothetical protein